MTKFETIGMEMQLESTTKEEARRKFLRSCDTCCNRGIHLDCDHCAIAQYHKLVIATMENKNKKKKEVA